MAGAPIAAVNRLSLGSWSTGSVGAALPSRAQIATTLVGSTLLLAPCVLGYEMGGYRTDRQTIQGLIDIGAGSLR